MCVMVVVFIFRFCVWVGLMCILDVEFFLLVYFGIRFIFINGDLSGLLNCVLGYIGLY